MRPESVGSAYSFKQVAYAVRDERQVTARPFDGLVYTGYIIGADDYHWILVTSADLTTVLVHKSSAVLEIHSSASITTEPRGEEIRALTRSYRDWVLSNHFHQSAKGDLTHARSVHAKPAADPDHPVDHRDRDRHPVAQRVGGLSGQAD